MIYMNYHLLQLIKIFQLTTTDVEEDDYTQTFVSLVSESLCDDTILFLSEKIWKPIYMGHPFIVNGNPKTLEYLKSQGFKTFEQWWARII